MEIIPGTGWPKVLDYILRHEGTVMVVGTSDVGKSTFIRYLLQQFLNKGGKICLVDADVGQSSLGLPGTISRKIFRNIKDLNNFSPDQMVFAGVANPANDIAGMIGGTKELVLACGKKGVKTTLIDTTGLIHGQIGAALKSGKIRAIRPDFIVGIEREGEVRHMLSHIKPEYLKGIKIDLLKSSPSVKKRTPKLRSEYRAEKFRKYFRNSKTHGVPLNSQRLLYKRKALEESGYEPEPGTLVALNRNKKTLALGIYEGFEKGNILIKTPLKNVNKMNEIIFGDIRPERNDLTQSLKI